VATEKKMHSLSSVLTFGKYKGLTVAAVIKFNASYFHWAINNVPWFDMDADARKIAQRAVNKEREFSLQQQNAWAWGFGYEAKHGRRAYDRERIAIEFAERRKAGLPLPEITV
jgi:hypothetical protein